MLKVKLQYFDNLMQKADSLEKTLMPEKYTLATIRRTTMWNSLPLKDPKTEHQELSREKQDSSGIP